MPCPQFSPMATSYKTVAAHVVLKGSSLPSLSSGEKLYMEALSSHPNQSRLQGHNTCAFAPRLTAEGCNQHLEILQRFDLWICIFRLSWRNSGARPRGLEPWLMVVPPPRLRDGVSTSASSASALCPLLPSPLGNPGCGCRIAGSVGKASGTRKGLHVSGKYPCSWGVILY